MLALVDELRATGLRIGIRNGRFALAPTTKIDSEIRRQVRANTDSLVLAVKNAPAGLVELAIHAGIHEQGYRLSPAEIRKLQSHDDLYEVINCTSEEKQSWASALAIRAVQMRGKVPRGWDKTAHCRRCGPVYSYHDLDTLSCHWCELRRADKPFPQPELEGE